MLPNLSCLRSPGSTIVLLLLLTSCANTPFGDRVQRSLEADPQLEQNNPDLVSTPTPTPTPSVELPENFPFQIPLYEGATLIDVEEISQLVKSAGDNSTKPEDNSSAEEEEVELPPPPNTNTPAPESSTATEENPPVPAPPKTENTISTRWQTDDSPEQVKNFYRTEFQKNQWQFIEQPDNPPDRIVVRQGDLEVMVSTIEVPPDDSKSDDANSESENPTPLPTQYLIEYHRIDSETAANNSQPSPEATTSESPEPTTSESPEPTPEATASESAANDISQAPEPLRPYIRDLASLGVFSDVANAESSSLEPNKTITRRHYAKWLIRANNQIYANQPSKQIRLATTDTQPAFKDVPSSDPDFPTIQGLAEAGIIPSPLSGESTTVTFDPDKPLTRQDLILWKVPLDLRRSLPTASVDAVKETWGFQDASKIDPKALRAVLADRQNGDLANITRTFGYTTLFQPQKTVTRAEAAATLWYFGVSGDGRSAADALSLKQSQSN